MKSHFVGGDKRPVVSCFYQIKPNLELEHVMQLSSSVYCAALLKGSTAGGQHFGLRRQVTQPL